MFSGRDKTAIGFGLWIIKFGFKEDDGQESRAYGSAFCLPVLNRLPSNAQRLLPPLKCHSYGKGKPPR